MSFDKRMVTKTNYSDKLHDITGGVNSLLIHSNLTRLVDFIVSGKVTDVILTSL